MEMRSVLRRMGKKSFNPGTAASMFFLNAKDPRVIKATRKTMIEVGYKAQRLAHDVLSAPARKQVAKPPATLGKAPVDRKSTRLNSRSLMRISYAVFCLKKKNQLTS